MFAKFYIYFFILLAIAGGCREKSGGSGEVESDTMRDTSESDSLEDTDCEMVDVETEPDTSTGSGTSSSDTGIDTQAGPRGYFIAVHNEPSHQLNGEIFIAEEYEILRGIVAEADSYGISLTLMFPPQWADYITKNAGRFAEVKSWQKGGHELAVHHHSIFHGKWDGYTDYTETEAHAVRRAKGIDPPEDYLGTLSHYSSKIALLGEDIRSGCANDEHDKNALPTTILYDTCSGFANSGPVGVRIGDFESANKAVNEYVLRGTWNGVERYWLAHYQVTMPERVEAAQDVFDAMDGGVFGAAVHSKQSQAEQLSDFMKFLGERDPGAKRSFTLVEIMEAEMLPEQILSNDLLVEKYDTGPCGDGICAPAEKTNPDLCPIDCP